jgi:hypothetical protein
METCDMKKSFKILQRLEENVKIRAIVHSETSKYYQKVWNYIKYPTIIISMIINSTIFTTIYNHGASIELFLAGNIITILCNIVIALESYIEFEKIINSHSYYVREYTRVYRMICAFYQKNLLQKEQLHKDILAHFIDTVQNCIHILQEDEPVCPQKIVKKTMDYHIDIHFYVSCTQKLRNKYTHENIMEIKKIRTDVLIQIIDKIFKDMSIHKKYSGFYRYFEKPHSRKEIFNYIILEKNISYKDLMEMYEKVNVFEMTSYDENDIDIFECDPNHFILITIDSSSSSDSNPPSPHTHDPNMML